MADTVALLSTEALTFAVGGIRAVNNVNFSLAERELRCLIGPNGAGKTTFFRCLTKIYRPTSGRINFRGQDITRLATHEVARLGVGIKTQVPSVFDGLTVRQNLQLAASRKHRRDAITRAADAAIERLSLGKIAGNLAGGLSHGQRQWVELGIVIASEPILILLDEPTAGMTRSEVEYTAQLIRELNKMTALIVVEHDLQFIRSLAAHVTVFHQGGILVENDAAAVLCDPRVRDIYFGQGLK